jgi:hypothetical protein
MSRDVSPLLATHDHHAETRFEHAPTAARDSSSAIRTEHRRLANANMASNGALQHRQNDVAQKSGKSSMAVTLSYCLDWIILLAVFIGAVFIGLAKPRERPFQLENPDIS